MSNESSVKIVIGAVVLLAACMGYRIMHPATTFAVEGIDESWDEAVKYRDPSRPTLVMVTADWCPSCRELRSEVILRNDVQEYLHTHYNIYTVDLSSSRLEARRHAARLGATTIPTLIRYDLEGHETARRHGGSPEDVMAWLKAGE